MTPMDLILDGSAAMRRAEELQSTVTDLEKRARWAEKLLDDVMVLCEAGKPTNQIYSMLHLALLERARNLKPDSALHRASDERSPA